MSRPRSWFMVGTALLPVTLAGCVTGAEVAGYADPDAGFSVVQASTGAALGKQTVWTKSTDQADAVAARVHALVHRRTIDADTAVQAGLLANRGLQASYSAIGISAADVWQETMPINPRLSIDASKLGVGRTIEATVAGNIVAAFTQRRRVDVAAARFRKAQLEAALMTLRVAAETRRAWIEAVAAWERVAYLNRAQKAADAASDLAGQLGRTGAYPKGKQAREHAFYAEVTADAAKARMEAQLAKERLTRQIGLWGADIDYFVPNALPPLPRSVSRSPGIEAAALAGRVDLAMAKEELRILALSYGLKDATRYVGDLELTGGIEVERTEGKDEVSGIVGAEFEIPVFDTGKARLRKAELAYMQAANLLAQKAVNIRSEAREAEQRYRAAYKIARHYHDNVVPLRRAVSEQSELTYNGMITSTFDLLADTRSETEAEVALISAKRDFWLAEAGRRAAIDGGGEGMGAAVADNSDNGSE